MNEYAEKIKSLAIHAQKRELRPGDKMPTVIHYGTEKPLVIASDGVLEKAEIDYIIEHERAKEAEERKIVKPKKTWTLEEEKKPDGMYTHVTVEEK